MNAVARPRLMTDDEFDRFVASGASAALGRVELREGALVRMAPQHMLPGRAKYTIAKALEAAIARSGLDLETDIEVTVRFGRGFQPYADVIVWRGPFADGPIPGQLVVEVCDSTLADDLGAKRMEYARAGLPEYWVLDVRGRVLHCFDTPAGEVYAGARFVREGEIAQSATLSELSLAPALPR